jgi:hypothetical protein
MNEKARLLHFRECQETVHVRADPSSINDTGAAEDRDVLRHVGARQSEFSLKVRHSALAVVQH